MSRFGWAYVSSAITGAVANGPTNSIQFNSGSQVLSGTSNFTFDPLTSKVTLLGQLTGSTLVISASVVSASTYLGITAGGVPGGPNQTIQFNSGSTFSGSSNLTFNSATNTLFLTGTFNSGDILGSGALKGAYTIFTSNFNVSKSAYFLAISSTGSAITASLSNASQYQAGQTLIFKDTGGAAGTNNILIRPSGSQTIDGATGGVRIAANSGSITLISNGTDQFFIVASR